MFVVQTVKLNKLTNLEAVCLSLRWLLKRGTEQNGVERSVIFRFFPLKFRIRVRDTEIEVFRSREGYSMASRQKNSEKNGME